MEVEVVNEYKPSAKPLADEKKKHIYSLVRRSTEIEIDLIKPNAFFKKMSEPTESRLFSFMKQVSETAEERLDSHNVSRIVEIGHGGKWRWRTIKTTAELRELLGKAEQHWSKFMLLREGELIAGLKAKEDYWGFVSDAGSSSSSSAFDTRSEYTPLVGSPFFKQMYLSDYWEMHSKLFWYKNYSGIAKFIIDITRNFVMGSGFNVTFLEDEDGKQNDIWNAYQDKSQIQMKAALWCDDLTWAGENMVKRIPGPDGTRHESFDPSTIWDIITDPENIRDVKYYHQQYNTQYQLFSTKDAPISKYIINQLPPQLVIHSRVNITPYEKRGRSDLLSALLYFKYFEDYMQAKLIRAKNESAFIWDVEVDGDNTDIQAYINATASLADVPPGSENVHNKAIKRTPLSPKLSSGKSADNISQEILSYVAMATQIPVNYMGTFGTGGYTKAGALVATEPVSKKFTERQRVMEQLLRKVVRDVMLDAGQKNAKFEVNFPELFEEDSSNRCKDLYLAKDEMVLSHKTMSTMVSKQLKITRYDYEKEQQQIEVEQKNPMLLGPMNDPSLGPLNPGKDPSGADGTDDSGRGSFDRDEVKKQGKQL